MSRARRRRGVLTGVVVLALAAIAAGGVAFAHSLGAPDRSTGAAGTTSVPPQGDPVAATRTSASPAIATDGSIVTRVAPVPTSVATDPVTAKPTAPPTAGAHTRAVRVVLTRASYDTSGATAAGFVAQTVEQGGTCTLTLAKDGSTVTTTGSAQADAESTTCGSLTVPAGRLSSGTWQATLSYASSTSTGTSSPLPVTVP